MSDKTPLQIVLEQAEDEGLWFEARTAPEAYLQQELRKLHAAVEQQADENARLRARVERLEGAIRWALGEEGEWDEEPPPIAGKWRRRYWWRSELRERAALKESEG